MSLRPRRSVLFMPGSNERAIEKSKSLPADVLIFDLEDAVAPEQKTNARKLVLSAISRGGFGDRELAIRVNGLDTEWFEEDLSAVSQAPVSAICVPKIESAQQLQQAARCMKSCDAPLDMELWSMIETPRGVLNVQEIAAADSRLGLLLLGTSDLSKELQIPQTEDRLGLLTSLTRCVLAARAQGLDVIDGVQLNLEDDDALLRACEQGRQFGFNGKSLIHPKQIETANTVFAPTTEEIDYAQKIIDAWKITAAAGKAVVVVDGKLVEVLHVEGAKRTLAIVEAINSRPMPLSD